jgi:protein O-GlcNAc transferase
VITAQRGNFTDAEIFLRRATKLHPESFSVHANLGNLFKQNNRMSEAETSYRHALALKPDFADAYSNLGIVLMDTGRMTEAKAACRRAIELKPDFAEAHNNFGLVLKDSGQPELAAAHYRQALKIKPDYAEALNNLGIELQVMGQVDNALASFQRALELKADSVVTHSNLIFTRDLMVDADQKTLLGERKRWNAMHAAHLYQQQKFQNIPYPERRLRVGYVSADFRNHSAATAFGSMLINFDSTNFEVIAYSNTIKEDILTREFQQCVTSWRSIVGLSDNAASDLIRQDKIDILVDLSGHTAGNRLLVFARKPAPIQITAWGYASGTGMSAMDVFFTDPVMVPPEEKHLHVEKIRYLPSAIGYYHYGSAPPVNPLPALSGKNITFGSFNRLLKNSKEAYHTWAQVLHRLPDSRMILKTQALDDPDTRARVTGYFTQAGIAPERIILMGGTSRDAHMSAFNHVDISLDPFPHGGGVSALEGLIMGVPLVTLRWPTLVGRVSASIMTSIGLDDWVAETQEQYIELAVQKAENLQSLAELRQNLRDLFTSSILGDKVAYTRIAEHEYRKLWKEWCLLAEK